MPFFSSDYNCWRLLHGLGCLIALSMLGGALYLQLTEFVMPCLLCVYLRLLTILYALTSLIALSHQPKACGQKIYMSLCLFYSLVGIAVSVYLLWLQMQPVAQNISCEQGVGASLIDWPFGETLVLLFSSYGNCADVPWTWLGLTLPMLSLFGFIGLFVFEIGKRWVFSKKFTYILADKHVK